MCRPLETYRNIEYRQLIFCNICYNFTDTIGKQQKFELNIDTIDTVIERNLINIEFVS